MSIIRDGFQSADLDVPVVLPTLNLDFANSQELDPRITFTRGSVGTFVNKNGLIETAAANIPRFDYDPISGECKGLLIEESRVNLLTSSNSFGAGDANYGITASATTSPDGTTNASLIFEKATNNFHYYNANITSTIGTTYCGSLFVKYSGSNRYARIKLGSNAGLTIDLIRGSIQTVPSGTVNYGLIPYPNGWYRMYATWVATVTNEGYQIFLMSDDASPSSLYQGDGSSGYFIYGAQVEAGSFPTSYIPTSGSTVTRSAEIAEITGTNFSSWYNQTEGTFFFDGTLPFTTNDTLNRVPFGVSNGYNFSNSMYVSKGSTSLGLSFSVINNNVSQSTGTSLPNMTSSRFKIASSVADKNIYSCGYGGTVNKHSRPSAAIPSVNRLTLGKEPWNLSTLNPIIGTIRKFAYYPKALSPAQLQYLTQ